MQSLLTFGKSQVTSIIIDQYFQLSKTAIIIHIDNIST